MKFGKRLAMAAYPEWKDHYIDYKSLKQILNQIDPAAGFLERSAEANAQLDGLFVSSLLLQMQKVSRFYLQKTAELSDRISDLLPELAPPEVVQRILARVSSAAEDGATNVAAAELTVPGAAEGARAQLGNSSSTATQDSTAKQEPAAAEAEAAAAVGPAHAATAAAAAAAPDSEGSQAEVSKTSAARPRWPYEVKTPEQERTLYAFLKLCTEIDLVRHFSVLNCLAVVKVVKKHDKCSPLKMREVFTSLIVTQPFYSADVLVPTFLLAKAIVSEIFAPTSGDQSLRLTADVSCTICSNRISIGSFMAGSKRVCQQCIYKSAGDEGDGGDQVATGATGLSPKTVMPQNINVVPLIAPEVSKSFGLKVEAADAALPPLAAAPRCAVAMGASRFAAALGGSPLWLGKLSKGDSAGDAVMSPGGSPFSGTGDSPLLGASILLPTPMEPSSTRDDITHLLETTWNTGYTCEEEMSLLQSLHAATSSSPRESNTDGDGHGGMSFSSSNLGGGFGALMPPGEPELRAQAGHRISDLMENLHAPAMGSDASLLDPPPEHHLFQAPSGLTTSAAHGNVARATAPAKARKWACLECRKAKSACEGGGGGHPCRRCTRLGKECIEKDRAKKRARKGDVLSDPQPPPIEQLPCPSLPAAGAPSGVSIPEL